MFVLKALYRARAWSGHHLVQSHNNYNARVDEELDGTNPLFFVLVFHGESAYCWPLC